MTPSGLPKLQADAPKLILASGSASRRALLRAAGLRFDSVSPDIDEAMVKRATRVAGGTAEQAALALASLKAAAIGDPDALILGCDQILVCDGVWFDKPANLEAARRQLLDLRGRMHTLATAIVCRFRGEGVWRHVETPTLTMRGFSTAFVEAYVHAEGAALLASVGAYRVEGLGIHLFERIEGDHHAILGLPLAKLLEFLRGRGVVLA